MGGTVSEPDWKQDLRDAVAYHVGGTETDREDAYQALLRFIDAAYQRGLTAGRSQAGYTTRRKSKEPPCAPSAETPSPASSTGSEG